MQKSRKVYKQVEEREVKNTRENSKTYIHDKHAGLMNEITQTNKSISF